MKRLLTKCPACREDMIITALKCPSCGLELRNDFEPSVFDRVSDEQYAFLVSFLRNRGNLKKLQEEQGLSYPSAKKKLEELLEALGLSSPREEAPSGTEVDLSNMEVDDTSMRASEIIKAKLKEAGGRVMVRTYSGELREITAAPNGKEFLCPQLIPYPYEIFDAIVDLLLARPGYRARKGNARMAKLGEPGCEENTVAGAVLLFLGKKPGESGLDPTFILVAVLEWAGIATNGRGEISLKASYTSKL